MSVTRRVRPPARVAAAVALILVLGGPGAAGCAGLEGRSGLEGARSSDEAVATAVLEAIAAGDREALERLLLTEEEHRELLWEQLPESNTWSFEYVRWLTEYNTEKGIARALRKWGGASYELLRIDYAREREEYDGFTLHRGAVLHVRRSTDGAEGIMEVLNVLVERNGEWKPMNYTD